MPYSRPHSSPASRRATTLIEVIIATAILAVGVATVLGTVFSLDRTRKDTDEYAAAQRVLATVVERLASTPWEDLRTINAAWSFSRHAPNADGTWPGIAADRSYPGASSTASIPLSEQAADSQNTLDDARDDLLSQGFLSGPSGLEDLQVYIEYYRACSVFNTATATIANATQGRPGLLCEANPEKPTTSAAFNAIFADKTKRDSYLLGTAEASPLTSLRITDGGGVDHQDDSVIVRVVVVWRSRDPGAGSLPGWATAWGAATAAAPRAANFARANRRLVAWTGRRP